MIKLDKKYKFISMKDFALVEVLGGFFYNTNSGVIECSIPTVGAVYITNAKSITNDRFAVFFPM